MGVHRRRQWILRFFDSVVDLDSNKLVLAVSTHLQIDWFVLCSEVYTEIEELIIFPMMKLLGIDSKTAENCTGWLGAKDSFKQIDELEQRTHNCDLSTGKGRLVAVDISVILDTLERQLQEMKFFKAETTD